MDKEITKTMFYSEERNELKEELEKALDKEQKKKIKKVASQINWEQSQEERRRLQGQLKQLIVQPYVEILYKYLKREEVFLDFGICLYANLCQIVGIKYSAPVSVEMRKDMLDKIIDKVKGIEHKPKNFIKSHIEPYLLNTYKRNPSREKVFEIALVLELNIDQVNDLLQKGCWDTSISFSDPNELIATYCLLEQLDYADYINMKNRFKDEVKIYGLGEKNEQVSYKKTKILKEEFEEEVKKSFQQSEYLEIKEKKIDQFFEILNEKNYGKDLKGFSNQRIEKFNELFEMVCDELFNIRREENDYFWDYLKDKISYLEKDAIDKMKNEVQMYDRWWNNGASEFLKDILCIYNHQEKIQVDRDIEEELRKLKKACDRAENSKDILSDIKYEPIYKQYVKSEQKKIKKIIDACNNPKQCYGQIEEILRATNHKKQIRERRWNNFKEQMFNMQKRTLKKDDQIDDLLIELGTNVFGIGNWDEIRKCSERENYNKYSLMDFQRELFGSQINEKFRYQMKRDSLSINEINEMKEEFTQKWNEFFIPLSKADVSVKLNELFGGINQFQINEEQMEPKEIEKKLKDLAPELDYKVENSGQLRMKEISLNNIYLTLKARENYKEYNELQMRGNDEDRLEYLERHITPPTRKEYLILLFALANWSVGTNSECEDSDSILDCEDGDPISDYFKEKADEYLKAAGFEGLYDGSFMDILLTTYLIINSQIERLGTGVCEFTVVDLLKYIIEQ